MIQLYELRQRVAAPRVDDTYDTYIYTRYVHAGTYLPTYLSTLVSSNRRLGAATPRFRLGSSKIQDFNSLDPGGVGDFHRSLVHSYSLVRLRKSNRRPGDARTSPKLTELRSYRYISWLGEVRLGRLTQVSSEGGWTADCRKAESFFFPSTISFDEIPRGLNVGWLGYARFHDEGERSDSAPAYTNTSVSYVHLHMRYIPVCRTAVYTYVRSTSLCPIPPARWALSDAYKVASEHPTSIDLCRV